MPLSARLTRRAFLDRGLKASLAIGGGLSTAALLDAAAYEDRARNLIAPAVRGDRDVPDRRRVRDPALAQEAQDVVEEAGAGGLRWGGKLASQLRADAGLADRHVLAGLYSSPDEIYIAPGGGLCAFHRGSGSGLQG